MLEKINSFIKKIEAYRHVNGPQPVKLFIVATDTAALLGAFAITDAGISWVTSVRMWSRDDALKHAQDVMNAIPDIDPNIGAMKWPAE